MTNHEKMRQLGRMIHERMEALLPRPAGWRVISDGRDSSMTVRVISGHGGYGNDGVRISVGQGNGTIDVRGDVEIADTRGCTVRRYLDRLDFDFRLSAVSILAALVDARMLERVCEATASAAAEVTEHNATHAAEDANAAALAEAFPNGRRQRADSVGITVPLANGLALGVIPCPTGFVTGVSDGVITLAQVKAVVAGLEAVAL